jgi:hypothetical protein
MFLLNRSGRLERPTGSIHRAGWSGLMDRDAEDYD